MADFRMDALIAMQKANIETLVQAQSVMADAVQEIARLQLGWFQDCVARTQGVMQADTDKRDVFADVREVADKTVETGKKQADIGVKAQQKAAELITARAQKNMDEAKSLAA